MTHDYVHHDSTTKEEILCHYSFVLRPSLQHLTTSTMQRPRWKAWRSSDVWWCHYVKQTEGRHIHGAVPDEEYRDPFDLSVYHLSKDWKGQRPGKQAVGNVVQACCNLQFYDP